MLVDKITNRESGIVLYGITPPKSVDFSEQNWRQLKSFADEKGIPIGCNIESVAIRKVEVDASIELLQRISK